MSTHLILETLKDKMDDNLRRSIDALRGIMTVLPAYKECDHCHERRYLTHRVSSDEIRMEVCLICGIEAERLAEKTAGHAGALKVEKI
jgi:hypothetical protein